MYTKNHLKHISFDLYNPISKKLLYGPTVGGPHTPHFLVHIPSCHLFLFAGAPK